MMKHLPYRARGAEPHSWGTAPTCRLPAKTLRGLVGTGCRPRCRPVRGTRSRKSRLLRLAHLRAVRRGVEPRGATQREAVPGGAADARCRSRRIDASSSDGEPAQAGVNALVSASPPPPPLADQAVLFLRRSRR